jgi:transposase
MPRNRELTAEERCQIITLHNINIKNVDIARQMNRGESTIRAVINRWRDSKKFSSAHRSGRPQKLGERDARRLMLIVKRNRKATLEDIHQDLRLNVHKETIGRKLRKLHFRSRKAIRKPFISKKNAKARRLWSKLHLGWTLKDWKRVIWSDECSIQLWQGSRDRRIRRTSQENPIRVGIAPTIKFGGGSLMIWACFCWDKLGPIITIEGSVDQVKYIKILGENLLPFWKRMKRCYRSPIFQDDGARPHRAISVNNWKREHNIRSLSWPAQSPDLNPIENIWSILKERIRKRIPHPTNLKQLEKYVHEEWDQLDPLMLRNLVKSIRRRNRLVFFARGYQSKY